MKKFLSKYYIYILFAAYFIICILRAAKGFCWSDESFYFSTTDRFFKGDMPIRDEWWRTQMSSVFCLPFYAVFHAITGSSEGVILYFRVLYVIASTILSAISYRIIKKSYPVPVALSIATLVMFYAHLNITTFSYYMLSVMFLFLALLLIYDYYDSKSKTGLIIAGFAYAISVLSLPTLAVPYILLIVLIGIVLIIRRMAALPDKANIIIDSMELPTVVIYSFIGIAIPAAIILIYLFANIPVKDFIKSVPYVLTDKEHDFTYKFAIKKFFTAVRDVYGKYTYLSILIIFVSAVLPRKIKDTVVTDILVAIDTLLFIIYAVKSFGYTGYILSALCLFTLPLFFLSNRKNIRMFILFIIGGATLSMTYSLSSNGQLYILAIGHFIIAISGICFAYDFVISRNAKSIAATFCGLLISVAVLYTCCSTIYLRIVNVYRDAPVAELNSRISEGPAKGLYTTSEHLSYYNDVCETIKDYCMKSNNPDNSTIMFSKICPWGYMYTDLECAMPTTWRTNSYSEEQFEGYYDVNPDKKPSVILVLNEEYGSYDACGDVDDDHNPNLDEMNDFWLKYIEENNMNATAVKCGTLYTMQ